MTPERLGILAAFPAALLLTAVTLDPRAPLYLTLALVLGVALPQIRSLSQGGWR